MQQQQQAGGVCKTFKLFFATQDIRRVTLDNVATWEAFHQQLIDLYPHTHHPELTIRYKDDEGDLISITCQHEWEAMLEATHDQSTVRLLLSEGPNQGKYFKDGPAAVTQSAYVQTNDSCAPVEQGSMRTLQVQLPRCLARFFPGGQILPTSVPSWLQGCIEIKRVEAENPTLDLDVDVTKLFEQLHEQAMGCIGADKERSVMENGKKYLQSMLDLVPTHPVANYNMACVHSLLGHLQEAADSLRAAIQGGYNNLKHMMQDADLENLRATPYFNDLVQLLQRQLNQHTTTSPTTTSPSSSAEEAPMTQMSELPCEPIDVPQPQAVATVTVIEAKQVEREPIVVVEQVEVSPAPIVTAFATQQATLQSMGFCDIERNESLLVRRRGDITKCINDLLA
eukprot:TRINITY_DN378_c0_g1_i2.p1 TRINITY_DN378_c0_g1~~TRINITY_DN378_c0_g1_i2.p1  ORF type:complete len:411 (+),score=102.49 TRINITY_DN378_c0_g1_i2:47-1234(+)